ncbi:MAG: hypothetical protein AVDCRST_MAG93-2932 [uncultured Chloroflexia bacterium]|uniref:DUF393 domain-containing protein n=1 Tax=uncultured Chloroflexia bacterium TaxID=1672391 RepID=A0A6J4JE52_9CHLR|nr:MAG: hypothetical protein AVDCRST_MAG93-2932 [uncultured Chloroflexia bacterium]
MDAVTTPALEIVYDGDCPFCSRFVELYRIRKNVGSVALTDARGRPDLVERFTREGLDINDGMVVFWQGRTYYGPDSVNLMAMLAAERGAFSALNRLLFKNRRVAGLIYPLLVRGRKLTLKAIGRKLIPTSYGDEKRTLL